MECEAQANGAAIVAIGGIENHVHLLLCIAPTMPISHLVKQIKGVSSRFANAELGFNGSFRWQGSYAAFSVSRWDVELVKNYILNQKEHHAHGTTRPQLELACD